MSDSTPARRRRIITENRGYIVVVEFVDRKILKAENIQMIGEDLARLVDEFGKRCILLNFGNVEFLSCAGIGKFITLRRKIAAVQGQLVLCGVCLEVMELFAISKLDKLFAFATNEEDALSRFAV